MRALGFGTDSPQWDEMIAILPVRVFEGLIPVWKAGAYDVIK